MTERLGKVRDQTTDRVSEDNRILTFEVSRKQEGLLLLLVSRLRNRRVRQSQPKEFEVERRELSTEVTHTLIEVRIGEEVEVPLLHEETLVIPVGP